MTFFDIIKILISLIDANLALSFSFFLITISLLSYYFYKFLKENFKSIDSNFDKNHITINEIHDKLEIIKDNIDNFKDESVSNLNTIKEGLKEIKFEIKNISERLNELKSAHGVESDKTQQLLHEIDKNVNKLEGKIKVIYALIDKIEV